MAFLWALNAIIALALYYLTKPVLNVLSDNKPSLKDRTNAKKVHRNVCLLIFFLGFLITIKGWYI